MILNITCKRVMIVGDELTMVSDDIDDSIEQMEHLIDFIAERYGRDRMVKYVDSVYKSED